MEGRGARYREEMAKGKRRNLSEGLRYNGEVMTENYDGEASWIR